MRFETEMLNMENYQGNAVVDYMDAETLYIRIIEYKHFEFDTQEKTIVTKEHSKTLEKGDEPYYPVNNERNNHLCKEYKKLVNVQSKAMSSLGLFRSIPLHDMHQVIAVTLQCVRNEVD
ncbi:UDP-galactopyranose mutase [Streptococcus merionis]|uniref:UDP-galactopyranose mutase n=1 Tax=Streptococcus merionis TaxID=400065 RepID=A0A239SS22_9STRE|nr:UDP-galactopyranose mutase [Streptococcus merionis]